MLVYRICSAKWAKSLSSSGLPARWNSDGKYVIYTSENRSLACLENLVHRSGEGLSGLFKILTIKIPKAATIQQVKLNQLSQNWQAYKNAQLTRAIGDKWYYQMENLLLQVPSSIIPEEYNFIINTNHLLFSKVKIEDVAEFNFDTRLK